MAPVPAVVISGFLGAGKTTTVSYLLENAFNRRLYVLVNDFGDLDIDADLIGQRTADVISLANGCICCSRQGELVDQLADLPGDFDAIVIEASGVSDPGSIIRALRYPRLRDRVYLDSVITVVDPAQFKQLEGDTLRLACAQLENADLVLLNKSDLSDTETRVQFRDDWLFPRSRVYETSHGKLPIEMALGIGHVESGEPTASVQHDGLESWTWESTEPVEAETLRTWLLQLPGNIYRAKGFGDLADFPGKRCLVQMSGGRVELGPLSSWKGSPRTRLVFIGEAGSRPATIAEPGKS